MATVALDEWTQELIRGGVVYNLTSGTMSYLMEYSGLGLPPSTNFFERGPLQDGSTRRGFRLDSRSFGQTFFVPSPCIEQRRARLSEFLDIFSVSDDLLTFRFVLPDGTLRLLDFTLDGEANVASSERASRIRDYGQFVAMSFMAPDPTFYAPTALVATLELADSEGFSIPTPIPTPIGESFLDDTITIEYEGTANSYPIIRINGPITNPVITNETTDATIEFADGTEIVLGDYCEIDTRYGRRTIVDSNGDEISSLLPSTSLASFYLLRNREAPNGNVITVTGDNVSGATSITITYYNRYGSLY